jgi:hypothetical protein
MAAKTWSEAGVVSGLNSVEPRTRPRLSAISPSAACAQPVDEPPIGMAVTRASPTRMISTSSGSCQARKAGIVTARNRSGTAKFVARPTSFILGRRAIPSTRPNRTRMPALNKRSERRSFDRFMVTNPRGDWIPTICASLIHRPGEGAVAARQ